MLCISAMAWRFLYGAEKWAHLSQTLYWSFDFCIDLFWKTTIIMFYRISCKQIVFQFKDEKLRLWSFSFRMCLCGVDSGSTHRCFDVADHSNGYGNGHKTANDSIGCCALSIHSQKLQYSKWNVLTYLPVDVVYAQDGTLARALTHDAHYMNAF